ncbi:unnamed protein product [Phytophthora lilii]|uniref:Unnamed protein product n=1 Tax=Phytophthora lilii TaxID=2077276 RepID=A0A9W6TD66_9STRA|nr:unnamed protein product [Phytophthora lilii]
MRPWQQRCNLSSRQPLAFDNTALLAILPLLCNRSSSDRNSNLNSGMKFPLAHAPFAPLRLSAGDRKEVAELADIFVQQTLADYETHLDVQHGVVDEVRWKMFKRFEDVVVYQDRKALRPQRLTLAGSGSESSSYEQQEGAKDMQKLLWFGTVQGSLDDIMYGVVNPTAEEAKVKAAYVGNNVLDFAVLDTIVHPTEDDPFRGLQIKWAVNGGPSVMRAVVRCRDFVYLESTGMTTSSTGERVGYHILHSVAIPGAPELHEHKIIRGNMTLYHLYRQKSKGVVETYVKAFIDVMGDLPSSIATIASAKGVVSVWKLGDYAEMKKLMWLLKQHKAMPPYQDSSSGFCRVCHKDVSGALSPTTALSDSPRRLQCWSLNVVASSKRFPLPVSPFAPLRLSQPDENAIANIANDLVVTTLVDYEMLQLREGGIMNPPRWKVVKRFDNLVGYQDRRHRRRMSDVDDDRCPRLVWRGTLEGSLSDIMYGAINQTDGEAQTKAAYVRSNIVDSNVLASLVKATPSDPFKGLQVKWMVFASGPGLQRLVRMREFVFLEATGVVRRPSGESVGYQLIDSISIPELRPLSEHNLVRGSISLLHLFRETIPDTVEVYSKASLDLMVSMPTRLAMYAACKTMEKGPTAVWSIAPLAAPEYLVTSLFASSATIQSKSTTMKFPLSACPFQPLELTDSEKETIKSISDGILSETMAEYERMLVQGHGVLDTERWKLIKRKENLAAYQDRCALAVTLQASTSTSKPTPESVEDPVAPPPAPTATLGPAPKAPLQRVLWHGTINCDLDDLMLGVVNQNADMWKVKSSYVEDNGLDYFLLASINERAIDKPFDGLQLKWTVNDMGPLVAKPIMRPRDFVFLESTGITQSPTTGERMGYHICHSLELPGVPELPDYKLVRGKMELYHIFRQKSKGVVEVYVRALCDLQGEMPSTSVALFSAEAMSTLTLTAFCAERHKVMWLLHTMEPCESGKPSLDLCSVFAQGELALENPTSIFYESAVNRSVSAVSSVSSG